MSNIDVQYALTEAEYEGLYVPSQEDIEKWAGAVLDSGPVSGAEVSFRIVGLDEGAFLNEYYRQKSGPTNVLSFPMSCPTEIGSRLLGDIVICAPLVKQEACEQNKELKLHWSHLVVHGVLHLLGFDHEDDCDAKIMEEMEIKILAKMGFPDPYKSEQCIDNGI